VARVDLPQAAGRQRPIGQPTREDQSVPRATVAGRHALDEQALLGFADGARPGRRPPQAVDAVTVGREKRPIHGGRAADLRGL
jgi:hypothetical protein